MRPIAKEDLCIGVMFYQVEVSRADIRGEDLMVFNDVHFNVSFKPRKGNRREQVLSTITAAPFTEQQREQVGAVLKAAFPNAMHCYVFMFMMLFFLTHIVCLCL